MPDHLSRRRFIEHGQIFNSTTHMFGTALAVAALVVLLWRGIASRDPWKLGSFAVYGAMLVALYVFSTLYHVLSGPAKRVFRKLDHLSIYLLIAGTYTPFALVTLRRRWGWPLLAVVWALAAVGIAQEFLFRERRRWLSVSLYLGMGWLAVAVFVPMLRAIGPAGMAWLLTGGLLYTAGVFFYVVDERLAHSHGVFHLFVVGGSIAHFLVVVRYVA
jgi:hemolysin III